MCCRCCDAGAPEITLEGVKAHTTVSLDSAQTEMFWACIEAFTVEERSRLLKFATGRIRLPVALKVEANGCAAACLPARLRASCAPPARLLRACAPAWHTSTVSRLVPSLRHALGAQSFARSFWCGVSCLVTVATNAARQRTPSQRQRPAIKSCTCRSIRAKPSWLRSFSTRLPIAWRSTRTAEDDAEAS